MSGRSRSVAPALVPLLTLLFVGASAAEVVLLHNGALFEGAVQRTPQGVAVENEGSLIRLRSADVAVVVESAIAAYEWKRAHTGEGDLTALDHLELADWALQNQLLPQAARELLDARQLVPMSRRLEILERRLDEAIDGPSDDLAQPEANAATEPPPNEPPANASVNPHRPALPAGALEQFTRRIQPVLINSCATSGCHGPNPAPGFALDLASVRGYGDARSTERNLHAALDLIDVHQPGQSRLLLAATGPHAGVSPVTGARREEMLQRITLWVTSIAYYNAPPVAEEAAPAGTPSVAPAVTQAAAIAPAVAAALTGNQPNAEPDWEAIVAAEEADPPQVQRGVELKPVEPRDDFDPAVFNARYRRPQDDASLAE